MTRDEWAEYKRRLTLREQHRRDTEIAAEWSDYPGRVWWWDEQDDR